MNGAMLLAEGGGMSPIILILYVVFFGGVLYFLFYRPSKKEKEAKEAMMAALEVGDTVKTTAGFYGTVINMDEDVVVVEFGNNKNCRIPMDKAAIIEIEKPADAEASE